MKQYIFSVFIFISIHAFPQNLTLQQAKKWLFQPLRNQSDEVRVDHIGKLYAVPKM